MEILFYYLGIMCGFAVLDVVYSIWVVICK